MNPYPGVVGAILRASRLGVEVLEVSQWSSTILMVRMNSAARDRLCHHPNLTAYELRTGGFSLSAPGVRCAGRMDCTGASTNVDTDDATLPNPESRASGVHIEPNLYLSLAFLGVLG